jgi:hypothetical protein
VGPFSWLPLIKLFGIADAPLGLGPLSLVPAMMIAAWPIARLSESPPRPWTWGKLDITLPMVGLTVLMLLSLRPAFERRTLVVIVTVILLWSTYLFVVNEKPTLTVPLALVILVQGGVALGQFVCQRDLGMAALGEPVLDPEVSGISVLWARESRWLRAYGLTGNPNLLGATLSVLLLLLVDEMVEARGWRQLCFTVVGSAGLLGLLTTFSRGSWLSFSLSLLGWMVRRTALERRAPRSPTWRSFLRQPQVLVPVVLAVLFLALHYDLVASRFLHLETPLEARSIRDRQLDADLAMQLIRQHPWLGVGVGNYLVAMRAIETNSRTVHNVPLLMAAELGLPGMTLWLWLALAGLLRPLSAGWVPWAAMLVTNVFDIGLSMTNSWYATVVFALLAGHVSLPCRAAQNSRMMDQERP